MKSPPTKPNISNFWMTNRKDLLECFFGENSPISLNEVENLSKICWACKHETSRTEKCHIIAKARNGSYEPSNFVLLCKTCHQYAPSVSFSDQPMIDWIKNHPSRMTLMIAQGQRLFSSIDPVKMEEVLKIGELPSLFLSLTKSHASDYYGRIAESTWEAILKEAVDRLCSSKQAT